MSATFAEICGGMVAPYRCEPRVGPAQRRSAPRGQGGIYPAERLARWLPDGAYAVTMPPGSTTRGVRRHRRTDHLLGRTDPPGRRAEINQPARPTACGLVLRGDRRRGVGTSSRAATLRRAWAAKVKAAMERLTQRFPDGVEAATIVDSIHEHRRRREGSCTLVIALTNIFIIYLFIQDWGDRHLLVAIPVSPVGAFALFPLLGFSVNIISLLGLVLAIGLRWTTPSSSSRPRRSTSPACGPRGGARSHEERRPPIVATTVVLAVFVPVSFTGGIRARLFQQFSITIAVPVVISAFNALTSPPALCALLLRPRTAAERDFSPLSIAGSPARWIVTRPLRRRRCARDAHGRILSPQSSG